MELDKKQDVFRSLQDTAEQLSLENHPAKQTVEVCGLRMCEGQKLQGGCCEGVQIRPCVCSAKSLEECPGSLLWGLLPFSLFQYPSEACHFDCLRMILGEALEYTWTLNFREKGDVNIFLQIAIRIHPASNCLMPFH